MHMRTQTPISPRDQRGSRDQGVFDWPHAPSLERADFMTAACNRDALAWIDRWPRWPAPSMLICGPEGAGKTHLLHIWAAQAGARVIDAGQLRTVMLHDAAAFGIGESTGDDGNDENGGALAVDHVDAGADGGPGDPVALFHLYNMMHAAGGQLLLAARDGPDAWHWSSADLRSRIKAGVQVQLGAPDDALLGALLVKLFADRQLSPSPELLRYLLARMPRSCAAALRLAAILDRLGLQRHQPITVPLARQALASPEMAG